MGNILEKIKSGKVSAEPALVVCDNPEAPAIEKAKKFGVHVALINRKLFNIKQAFEHEITCTVDSHKVDFIVLAGFMRILSPEFVQHYKGRIINIHPSYLPNFPGGHAISDAFNFKTKETGVTVHFVDEGVDTGQIILQRKVSIDPKDTLESLETKIHAVEYDIYPEALNLVLSGKVKMSHAN